MADVGVVEVKLPHMGVSVTEATVTVWHKALGDTVEEGEALCDIATDKVDTELPSPAAGIVQALLVDAGDTVDVGTTLALLASEAAVATGDGEAPAAPAADDQPPVASAAPTTDGQPPAASAAPAAPPVPAASASGNGARATTPGAPARVGAAPFDHASAAEEVAARAGASGRPTASPVARRLAAEHHLDLATISGTGLRGRIRKADVLAAVQAAPVAPAAAPAAAAPAPEPAAVTSGATGDGLPRGYEDVPYEVVPTTHTRRVTAEHMIRSRQTAAHMTTEVEVDLQRLTDVRAALNAERAKAGRGKLSFLPFLTRVACAALREFPNLNATFESERYIRWGEVNVGIAVDTPQGLLVPVIRSCDSLTVETIGDRIVDLAERARSRKLTADDFRAGTFTISNPGSVGAVSAMAIINQPQVAILGVPAIVRRPWVVALPDGTESIAIRPILKLAITFDHRAIDGAEATRCAVLMKQCLERWDAQDYR